MSFEVANKSLQDNMELIRKHNERLPAWFPYKIKDAVIAPANYELEEILEIQKEMQAHNDNNERAIMMMGILPEQEFTVNLFHETPIGLSRTTLQFLLNGYSKHSSQ